MGDRDLGVQNFFNWFLKLTNQKRPKVTCLVRHGKIVSEDKLPSTAKQPLPISFVINGAKQQIISIIVQDAHIKPPNFALITNN